MKSLTNQELFSLFSKNLQKISRLVEKAGFLKSLGKVTALNRNESFLPACRISAPIHSLYNNHVTQHL